MATENISDKNNPKTVARKKGFRDLDLKLVLHPFRKDIIPLKDANAVKNAVKNLILTNFFERPFQPALGANLRGLLFEPMDSITELAIEDNIRRVLLKEPRIKVIYINAESDEDANHYNLTVKFRIKQSDQEEQVAIILRRLR